jgi:K+-sensing histidine kinase KdpD
MSDFIAQDAAALSPNDRASAAPGLPATSQYVISLLMVGAATLLAFVVDNLIAAPNLTLVFVLPVVVAGTAFGWGPSLTAVIAGVLAFDFFFTVPYFSFRISSPSDIWAAALLLVIAAIVTTVAAQSRRRAIEASCAADRAEALQALAHIVIENRPRAEVVQAAAASLQQIFRAPAVIYLQEAGALRRAAAAGRLEITAADEEAARGALSDRLHTRAGTYPYDKAAFEFWPVATPSGCGCVIGVDFTRAPGERPDKPERFVDVVAAYLAVALDAWPGDAGPGDAGPGKDSRRPGVSSRPNGSPRRP